MVGIINGLIEKLGLTITAILHSLPMSPFKFEETFNSSLLGWVNLIFPLGKMLQVLTLYLVAVGVYYLYRIVMRWIKLSGS